MCTVFLKPLEFNTQTSDYIHVKETWKEENVDMHTLQNNLKMKSVLFNCLVLAGYNLLWETFKNVSIVEKHLTCQVWGAHL